MFPSKSIIQSINPSQVESEDNYQIYILLPTIDILYDNFTQKFQSICIKEKEDEKMKACLNT